MSHEQEVRLRPVQESDLEVFLEYEHDEEAVRRSKFAPRERAAFMTHWSERVLGDPTGLVRTVLVGDQVAGNIVSWWDGERRFLGYWLGRAHWGHGVGTRALGLFLTEEKTRPLHADPHNGNTASVRLLEHHGFRHTGPVDEGHVLLILDEPEG